MNFLKQRREKRGLTQKQVAEALHIAEAQYQAYEHDRRTPNVYVALRIAKVLETTVEELWGEDAATDTL